MSDIIYPAVSDMTLLLSVCVRHDFTISGRVRHDFTISGRVRHDFTISGRVRHDFTRLCQRGLIILMSCVTLQYLTVSDMTLAAYDSGKSKWTLKITFAIPGFIGHDFVAPGCIRGL